MKMPTRLHLMPIFLELYFHAPTAPSWFGSWALRQIYIYILVLVTYPFIRLFICLLIVYCNGSWNRARTFRKLSSKLIGSTVTCNILNTEFDNVKEMSKKCIINRSTFVEMGEAEMEMARHDAQQQHGTVTSQQTSI
jgi:hypothetical protein